MKFAILKKDGKGYFPTDIISNDSYLDMLLMVFTDGISFLRSIKQELESNSRGITGNEIDIDVINKKVIISYTFDGDQAVVIESKDLIKILEKGIALMEAKADFIALLRENENSPITVSDQPPHGMKFFVEDLQLKATYKGKIYT